MKDRILFICKERHLYGSYSYTSTGLLTSVKFLVNMLNSQSIVAFGTEVVDNNSIDREITYYKPTHVIIEALWVVPEKFDILQRLHPNVTWIVRIHSEIPFLSTEGNAMSWIKGYHDRGVIVGSNSKTFINTVEPVLGFPIVYLPNYYEFSDNCYVKEKRSCINIGCFGAVRLLKNQLQQAFSAITFADNLDKTLHFHINSSRVEGTAHSVVKNLRGLFKDSRHKLIEHPWLNRKDFLKLIRKMDISMQVSFSESYNIVTADAISQNISVVVSPEIEFVHWLFKADPTDIEDIVRRLAMAYIGDFIGLQKLNKCKLEKFNRKVIKQWLNLFE